MDQGSDEWFSARLGRVTASRISDVMAKPTTQGYAKYRAELVFERLTKGSLERFVSDAMQHGIETEPQARAFYEMETGADVEQTGFIPHPIIEMAGASPDGLVGADGGLEIKCPTPLTHMDTLISGKIKREYLLQMQWGMACTGREWWDFVSFCPSLSGSTQMYVQRVERDEKQISEITSAVRSFLGEVDKAVRDLSGNQEG